MQIKRREEELKKGKREMTGKCGLTLYVLIDSSSGLIQ